MNLGTGSLPKPPTSGILTFSVPLLISLTLLKDKQSSLASLLTLVELFASEKIPNKHRRF